MERIVNNNFSVTSNRNIFNFHEHRELKNIIKKRMSALEK
jgi:hypothetical protein